MPGFSKIAALVLTSAVCAGLLFAHNKLVKTEPAADAALKAAPAKIELWFAEKPDVTLSKIALKGAAGPVELGAVTGTDKSIWAAVKGKLADGKYTVNWQTPGEDGHLSKGEFSFSVAAH